MSAKLLLCVLVCSVHAFYYGPGRELVEARASSGPPSGVFAGSWMTSRRGRRFRAYRGIRYAEPPVGDLRFKPPKPIYHYAQPVNASTEGPACPMPVPPGYPVSEDCLRVNIYTPHSGGRLLPVIAWLHPGAFYSFSARSDAFGPGYLMDRDLVLVTINYRLGSLGFLSTGDELAPGNNGLKDQVEALRWIQRNIAYFGGDPNLVTLAGCSAGAISAMLHIISPMSKGLFHRAILVSGSPVDKAPLPHHQRDLAARQASLLGCPSYSTRVILDCLKTKTAEEIANTLGGFFERFLPHQPAAAIRQGAFQAMPVIITQTRNEFFWKAFTILNNATLLSSMDRDWEEIAPISFQLPRGDRQASRWLREAYLDGRQLLNDTVTARGLGRLYGDALIGFQTHRLANLLCRNSPAPVFYGEFSYLGNNSFYQDPGSGEPVGVSHQDDLLYIFTITFRFPVISVTSPDSVKVDRMTAIWYNFARYGDPNPQPDTAELSTLRWPPMTPHTREYLRIGPTFSVHRRLFEDWFNVWEHIYPMDYEPDKTVVGLDWGLDPKMLG